MRCQIDGAPRIILLSGPRQVGKSTLCRKLVDILRTESFAVAGFLTTHKGPHDLEATEIHSGDRYRITLPFEDGARAELGRFRMDVAALDRGIASLTNALPADVLVVDELGPLEFRLKRGWSPILSMVMTGCCRVAVLVVRPELVTEALAHLADSTAMVIHVSLENRDAALDTLLRHVRAMALP